MGTHTHAWGLWVLVGMGKGQGKNTHGLPMLFTSWTRSITVGVNISDVLAPA